jgi:hypothetical protein
MNHASAHPSPLPPWDDLTGDVYLLRRLVMSDDREIPSYVELLSNVPQQLWLWDRIGYGWGPQRREGVTLALNVLHRLIPCPPGTVCDDWHVPLACHPDAYRFAVGFQERWLAPLLSWGGRLPGYGLRQWITRERMRWLAPGVDLSLVDPAMCWPTWPDE